MPRRRSPPPSARRPSLSRRATLAPRLAAHARCPPPRSGRGRGATAARTASSSFSAPWSAAAHVEAMRKPQQRAASTEMDQHLLPAPRARAGAAQGGACSATRRGRRRHHLSPTVPPRARAPKTRSRNARDGQARARRGRRAGSASRVIRARRRSHHRSRDRGPGMPRRRARSSAAPTSQHRHRCTRHSTIHEPGKSLERRRSESRSRITVPRTAASRRASIRDDTV